MKYKNISILKDVGMVGPKNKQDSILVHSEQLTTKKIHACNMRNATE